MSDRNERWIDISIRLAVLIAVGLVVYIAWVYGSHLISERSASPANRAVDNLKAEVRLTPQNPNARVMLAEALVAAGRLDEAVEQYKAALTIKKDFPAALHGLGLIAMQRKDWKMAAEYWQAIIRNLDKGDMASKDERLEQAYYGLGVTYLETERNEDAVVALKEALRIRSSASDTHYMLSVAYARLGYAEEQTDELGIVLAFDPNNAQANFDAGMLELKKGQEATAAELFRISADNTDEVELPDKELAKLASKSSASDRLAKARRLEATDPTGALTEARVSAALAPRDVAAVRLVARLWGRAKAADRAKNAWQHLLEMAPSDAEAIAALKTLEKPETARGR